MAQLGIYEHVKTGNRYRLVCVAKHHETLEEFAVYEALYDNTVSKFFIREFASFFGEAKALDGSTHPRFRFISPE